jgi:hypothetical protein
MSANACSQQLFGILSISRVSSFAVEEYTDSAPRALVVTTCFLWLCMRKVRMITPEPRSSAEPEYTDKFVDRLLLLIAALLVAGLSTGAALISQAYNISPAWLLSFWAGVGFLGGIGRATGCKNSNRRDSPPSQLSGW